MSPESTVCTHQASLGCNVSPTISHSLVASLGCTSFMVRKGSASSVLPCRSCSPPPCSSTSDEGGGLKNATWNACRRESSWPLNECLWMAWWWPAQQEEAMGWDEQKGLSLKWAVGMCVGC